VTISTSVDFLDTNILVYAVSRRAEDEKKKAAARSLIQPEGQAISLQVLQEFYRVAVHPKKLGLLHDEAVRFCDGWRKCFTVLEPTLRLFDESLELCARYQISYFDACIVAAAAEMGCTTVNSEDLNHGQTYNGVQVVNPFRDL
jgi:predicted nucleic acid-binding protein